MNHLDRLIDRIADRVLDRIRERELAEMRKGRSYDMRNPDDYAEFMASMQAPPVQ